MSKDYIPANDQEFLAWVLNYSGLITATPVAFGTNAGAATALAGLVTAFQSALTAATEPLTRGPHTILLKDQARASLVANCRALARQITGTMTVTDAQRDALGLTVRDADPTRIPVPGQAQVLVKSVDGRTVTARVIDPANPTRRGRPAGVQGIHVYSHVGETFPPELGLFKFQGAVTRTTVNVTFPEAAPGAKVWLVVAYYNPRGEEGAPSAPQSAFLAMGTVVSA